MTMSGQAVGIGDLSTRLGGHAIEDLGVGGRRRDEQRVPQVEMGGGSPRANPQRVPGNSTSRPHPGREGQGGEYSPGLFAECLCSPCR